MKADLRGPILGKKVELDNPKVADGTTQKKPGHNAKLKTAFAGLKFVSGQSTKEEFATETMGTWIGYAMEKRYPWCSGTL